MSTPRGLLALLRGAVDYAGTFPPASLDMASCVANYAAYRRSEQAWMLGRLVVQASQLTEFTERAANVLPHGVAPPWPLSAVAGAGAARDLSEIETFNRRHDGRSMSGRASVELIEIKVGTARDVRGLDESLPRGVRMVCEVVAGGTLPTTLQAIRDLDGIAKIRTGGVTADAIPSSEVVADFLLACHAARVPFKATAGLHHAVSAERPLTFVANGAHGWMHGFVNVLVASAVVHAAPRIADPHVRVQIVGILDEVDPTAFSFSDEGVRWRDVAIGEPAIAASRTEFGLSFGSCSFEEPLADLRAMRLAV